MDGARGARGWLAASTVALTLTLVLLAVEKHIRLPSTSYFQAERAAQVSAATTRQAGIVLSVDPGLAGVAQFARADTTPITRQESLSVESVASTLLRRPPEPTAQVVLQAPIASEPLTALPLHSTSSRMDYLMEAMDKALASPIVTTAAPLASQQPVPSFPLRSDRLAQLPEPASMAGRLPEPRRLLAQLAALAQALDSSNHDRATHTTAPRLTQPMEDRLISHTPSLADTRPALESLRNWIALTQSAVQRTTNQAGLDDPSIDSALLELQNLSGQAATLSASLEEYDLQRQVSTVAYSLQRRLDVWQAIQLCLRAGHEPLSTTSAAANARQEMQAALAAVSQKLIGTGDAEGWRTYLMLPALTDWANSPDDVWDEGNALALTVLSRLHWQRLTEAQQQFLAQPEFEELGAQLLVWGRDPVDYRNLLNDLETLEEDPISRASGPLASSVQVLRLSRDPQQQALATTMNNHYRNANLRLSIARPLIERLLPSEQTDSRPIRQNILGADTSGDSEIKTNLRIQLQPDPQAWNLGIGVAGDLLSLTRSSKGPAVFHSLSTAQIDSQRYIRIDPQGYQITSTPTQVASQDYLRKMSTDFDGLPIIGDLARLLVREQFDQKRGLARRISQRIIAREADQEFDRRLEDNLKQAEQELTSRLVGPLERLKLNPLVVAMNTTEDRLSIRYRVANEAQMAAFTPRPRAPSDALLSLQFHQSAINNTIAQIGLSGRTWTLPELYERLGEAFQGNRWTVPADMQAEVEDIHIRFADTRPATVELENGRMRLTLRIAEFRQGDRFVIERFVVSSHYIPVADGLTAELIRDGVVEIVSNHDRLKLRVIFAKIFVANPQIPLISHTWAEDPRSDGLAVSQVEIRDGWLAVAISPADSPLAAEVTARARELQLR